MANIVSVETANTYFTTRLHSDAWSTATSANKLAALTTAQNQLEVLYTLDSTDTAHKNSICEQALFLLVSGSGADQRTFLQALGVEETDRQGEKFRIGHAELPVCAFAKKALNSVQKTTGKHTVLSVDLVRDDTDYNA